MNIPPATAHLFLTDPPYNVDYEGGTNETLKIENDNMNDDDFCVFLKSAFNNANDYMKNGASFYIWHGDKTAKQFINSIVWEIRQILIWNKNSFVLGRHDYQTKHEPCFYGWKSGAAHNWYSDRTQTTILNFDKPKRNGEHPTMKPVELFAYLIGNSTQSGDTVLDLFGGSGTTLIAAEQTNRKSRIMELDERYADVIVKRYETLTGEKGIIL